MSYRLKNSDFNPFLDILKGKISDLWVHVGESIGIYFWMFLSGESIPRVGEKVESVMECWDGIRWRLGRFDRNWKEGDFCGDCCANCIAIWNTTN